jgi:hypothetical protein
MSLWGCIRPVVEKGEEIQQAVLSRTLELLSTYKHLAPGLPASVHVLVNITFFALGASWIAVSQNQKSQQLLLCVGGAGTSPSSSFALRAV